MQSHQYPFSTETSSTEILENLCLALRQVGILDDYLLGGHSPAIERVTPWIDEVHSLHSELMRRGDEVQSRIVLLSSETSWDMETLLQDCLGYPISIPFVQVGHHIRRAFQCSCCLIRECVEPKGRRWCDFCLDREAKDREARSTVAGAALDIYFRDIFVTLHEKGVTVDPGLSNAEMGTIERAWNLSFPPDLAQLLAIGLPVSHGFPDWRHGKYYDLRSFLDRPMEDIDWDVVYSTLWQEAWGPRPASAEDARIIAAQEVARAPKLIPINDYSYIPAEPLEAGNPIYLMHQTDIIQFGFDLPGYFTQAFRIPLPDWAARVPRAIQFWDTFL